MTRHKKEPYECPRCGYTTSKKPYANRHLYHLKKPCPSTKNDIELTDPIKQCILNNRVYHIPKKEDPQKIMQQTINYNNTMNNYISNMDTIEKITKLLKHQNVHLIGFNDHVRDTLEDHVEMLRQGDDIHLTKTDILDLVDVISKAKTSGKAMDTFNMIYDSNIKKLKLFDDEGEWSEHILQKGVQNIIRVIQEYYLERYECYLIRKIRSVTLRERQHMEELLHEYYKFIAIFEIEPVVKHKRDRDILYDFGTPEAASYPRDRVDIVEEFMKKYRKICDTISHREAISVRKHVVDIIKVNTKRNIDELDKKVVSLFNMDEDFKQTIMKKGIEESASDDGWNFTSDDDETYILAENLVK